MDKDLKRMPSETNDQYFYRVCKMKDDLGFTWPQMTEVFNEEFGCDKGESAYRKKWNAFETVMEANADTLFGDRSYLDAIEEAKYELEKERQKLYATKVELQRNIRQESRAELFYENIRNAVETLSMPDIFARPLCQQKANKDYLLCIADIQAGAKFTLPNNEYSLEICEKRFNKLLDDVIRYVVDDNIYKLKVVGLGDTVQGILRLTDLKLNETTVVEATILVARMIACFLNQLSAYCWVEYYHTPTSNHGQNRPIGSKASELAYEDMEYVIGNYIHDILRNNDRTNVYLNNGFDYIEIPIFDFNVMAMHGHTIRNIETALKDLSVTHRKLIDYVIIGHYHNGKVVPGNEHEHHDTEVLVCPSFQGTDPYAFNKLGRSSKAACKIFVFDEKYGCTGTEKFILN